MGEYAKPRIANIVAVPEIVAFPVHAGKRFLVTGATGGIGSALARQLVAEGASLVLADLDLDASRALAAELSTDETPVYGLALNLAEDSSIEEVVAEAITLLGGLDGLANVAGISIMAAAVDVTRDQWRLEMEINVFGPYRVAQEVARHLIAEGRAGMIVNVASDAGKHGHGELISYNASKAAVINWTRNAAAEWAQYNINVNCVCPSAVDTAMLRMVALDHEAGTGDDLETIYAAMAPQQLGRLITAGEVAAAISTLLDSRNQIVRGQAINVDGGTLPY